MNLFKREPKRELHLRINLPTGWSQLTVEQLEMVSRILIDAGRKYEQTGFYSQAQVFTRAFFELAGLRVIGVDHRDLFADHEETTEEIANHWFNCEFVNEEKRRNLQSVDGEIVPIRIYVYEVAEITKMLSTEMDKDGNVVPPTGGLNWLLKPSDIVKFPYPELTLDDPSASKRKPKKVTFYGPSYLMQNFTWRQYRNACDFISYLAKIENNLVRMQKESGRYGATRIAQMQQAVVKVRAEFLATVFNIEREHIEEETGQKIRSPYYLSSQCHDNERFFLNFPEEKFQCVSLWWQGMMQYLSKQYPKVFRKEKVGSDASDDPFRLYTRSVTTMIKYTGSNEEQVNKTTYTIILQHINDMAEENERYEQMKKR